MHPQPLAHQGTVGLLAPIFLIFVVLLSNAAHGDGASTGAVTFQGSGVARFGVVLEELFFAYKQLKPEVDFEFSAKNEFHALDAINDNELDFAVFDDKITEARLHQKTNFTVAFPIAVEPLVPAYNIPVSALKKDESSMPRAAALRLSRAVIAAIYNMNITNWNDPRVAALQTPEIAAVLPNEAIRLIVQGGLSEETEYLHEALLDWGGPSMAAGGGWLYGAGIVTNTSEEEEEEFGWSAAYRALPNVVSVPLEYNLAEGLAVNPYSFTMVELSLVETEGFTVFASIDNARGQNLTAPALSSAIPLSSVLDTEAFFEAIREPDGDGAWPIGSPLFVMLRSDNHSLTNGALSCEARRELWLFWRWLLTSDVAVERLSLEGYVPMGDAVVAKIVEYIDSVKCVVNGEEREAFLQEKALPQHEGDGYKAIIGLNICFLVITAGLVLGYTYSIKHRLSAPMLNLIIYFGMLLTGAILNYVAVIYFYEVPSTSEVCQRRVWLSCLGFTLLLSALFSRGYQIYAVHKLETVGVHIMRFVDHSTLQVSINATFFGLQLVLLIVWTALDPFHPVKTQVDSLNRTFTWICVSERTWLWWGLEIGFALVLEAFGLYVVYQTWNIRHMVKESKWVSIAIYNFLVVLTLLVALFGGMAMTDDSVLILGGLATTCLSFITMLSLFLPRFLGLRALADKDTDSSDNSDKRGSHLSHLSSGSAPRRQTTARASDEARSNSHVNASPRVISPSLELSSPSGHTLLPSSGPSPLGETSVDVRESSSDQVV